MSLGVVVKGTEGVVLAADSRVTLKVQQGSQEPVVINFDNASKLLAFQEPHRYVGAVTYGQAVIGLRTAHSFLPELEAALPTSRVSVKKFAGKLSAFYLDQWKQAYPGGTPPDVKMTFVVSGYDEPKSAYGSVYVFEIPDGAEPYERNPEQSFGITWGGQLQVASRLLHGFDPSLPGLLAAKLGKTQEEVAQALQASLRDLEFRIPYQVLPLQDCIDLATFLIRTTVTAQGLAVGVRGVGGTIEVAYIQRTKELTFVQRKRLRGEVGSSTGDGDEHSDQID